MMSEQIRLIARHQTGETLSRMLLGCFAAAAAATMAAVALHASAAELFPYNPPPRSAVQSRPQVQQLAPADELSADELRAIDDLATKTNRLPAAQKREVRASVVKSRENALTRRDWHQVDYYTELLKRIQDGQ